MLHLLKLSRHFFLVMKRICLPTEIKSKIIFEVDPNAAILTEHEKRRVLEFGAAFESLGKSADAFFGFVGILPSLELCRENRHKWSV